MTGTTQSLDDFRADNDRILDEIAKVHASRFNAASDLRANLEHIKTDHSDKTLAEIYEIADTLVSGESHHQHGALILDIMKYFFGPNPLLVAATLRRTWKGGKMGFVFLSDPATADMGDYSEEAEMLLDGLTDSWMVEDASPLLTNEDGERDLDFYNSLPERMTVYRGGHGITPERLAAGVCWTTSRNVAEWFAHRGLDTEPVVISARIPKHGIATVFASEFEVVCLPYRFRALKCRRKSTARRPKICWDD